MKSLRTAAAARYATERGRPTSPHTLRRLRLRGVDDPGEPGPVWVRDPDTTHCFYTTEALDAWVARWQARLQEATPMSRPAHLS